MVVDIEIRVAEYFAETLMFENRYQEKVFLDTRCLLLPFIILIFISHQTWNFKFGIVEQSQVCNSHLDTFLCIYISSQHSCNVMHSQICKYANMSLTRTKILRARFAKNGQTSNIAFTVEMTIHISKWPYQMLNSIWKESENSFQRRKMKKPCFRITKKEIWHFL